MYEPPDAGTTRLLAPEFAGEDTRAALMRAGRSEFALHGYDGASVRAITSAARANLGAITYHFGSKRKLYEEVVRASAAPLVAAIEAVVATEASPLDRVEGVLRTYFAFLRANPEVPMLLLQEVVLGREPPRAAAAPVGRIVKAVSGAVREGQESGAIRAGNPVLLTTSVVSQPVFAALVRRMLPVAGGPDPASEEVWAAIVENAAAFLRAGLRAPGGAT